MKSTPSILYIFLYKPRDCGIIKDLTRRMNRESEFLHLPPDQIVPETEVAVREGRRWQRGFVLQVERGDRVTVALRDWGRAVQRPMIEVYILEDRFRQLEWQAIPCGLGHIRPLEGRMRWTRRSIALTKRLVEKREGWIEIRRPVKDEAAIINFRARPESENETRDLAELLVQMGCTQHSEFEEVVAIPGILSFIHL
ncbi:uncharacterized protein LOC112461321 [Temnothorax curvispinosus]|uniref:Uncharacterized protein LOC112461321 n=1 Tax=Temnothorax curvispinosus TaxID=300111 RepID=A0A6J1QIR9_9HYME|nr:uncharacterized protein LOC112461321 [Temnothorax curvispinosus]